MVKLYVEGGGETQNLHRDCRRGFSAFLEAAGIAKLPRIVACGTRAKAYDRFCTAIKAGEEAFLLVDSEAPVASPCETGPSDTWRPWAHLQARDGALLAVRQARGLVRINLADKRPIRPDQRHRQ